MSGIQAANISKQEAIDSIPQLLAQQWEAVGVDRTSWPPCAQSMIDDLEDQIRLQLSEMDKQHAAIQSAHSGRVSSMYNLLFGPWNVMLERRMRLLFYFAYIGFCNLHTVSDIKHCTV